MATNNRKLKILCFHGYRQSAQVFRQKSGAFRSSMKKLADFVIVDAPHVLPPSPNFAPALDDEGSPLEQRGWWSSRDIPSISVDRGLSQSVERVESIIDSQGPFDGFLGFSQGASFAWILAQQLRNPVSFMILVAGFMNDHLLELIPNPDKVAIPTLLVIGESDKIIPKDLSESLSDYLTDCERLYHSGGHGIPIGAAQRKAYKAFMEKFIPPESSQETVESN